MMRMDNMAVPLLACALMLLAGAARAQDKPDTPTAVQGFQIITPERAHELLGKARFFDLRSAINYGKSHIRGAQALPYGERSDFTAAFDAGRDRFDLAKLPADRNATLVFYSDGPKGWKSYKAAVLAAKAGYRNVRWMRAGTTGWQDKGYLLEK